MDAKLVVVGGEAKAAEVQLKLPTIIGRGRDASLTLPHPLVSRQHCEIFESEGRLFVRDLGSLNGTFVNNEKLEGERELPSGNLLTIGTVTFRAVYEAENEETGDVGGDEPAAAPQPTESTAVASTAATVQVSNDPLVDPLDLTSGPTPMVDDEDASSFEFEEVEEIEEVEEGGLDFSDDTAPQEHVDSNSEVADDDFLDTFLKEIE